MTPIKIKYTDPVLGASSLVISGLAVRGSMRPDAWEHFPAVQNRFLNGDIDEWIQGFRRVIELDFGVIQTLAQQKAILYFCLDPLRELEVSVAAPGIGTTEISGSLTGTYYYVVTSCDDVGQSLKSTETSRTVTAKGIQVWWFPVSGAQSYRIYRTTSSGSYGTSSFLAETSAYLYNDTGAVALSQGQPPTTTSFRVALQSPESYSNEWLGNTELGRRYKLTVLERSIRTAFPV